ncbi:30S ribosomal protein S20 [Columbia Basin potato purple top phytoplasma]|uniref:Small ribosomal subunit protein bS20 n=1 Tax=Columbia Basin potato purple top phytoplasma TaxID=307134 RepID=A0ABT5LB96_9MOLU|nr:30S ribosomal protein S20 [Columbia Basin potato purple top phytoplasma]MDC9031997.1 30S ribosomal protein S20 [Columbia Basin potato purple top phytoplasma]
MANIKQQKKRIKTDEKRRLFRKSFKSSVKTFINHFNKSINSSDKDKANIFFNLINKKLDKGQSKGVYHKNFVSRNKSHFSKLLNSISSGR